jgi:hypothetical protein
VASSSLAAVPAARRNVRSATAARSGQEQLPAAAIRDPDRHRRPARPRARARPDLPVPLLASPHVYLDRRLDPLGSARDRRRSGRRCRSSRSTRWRRSPTRAPTSPAADWWRFNGEGYLDLGARLDELGQSTQDDSFSLGRGERRKREGIDARVVRDQVVRPCGHDPCEGGDTSAHRAALISLGRVQGSWKIPAGLGTETAATSFLASGNQDAAEAAIVALGWCHSDEAVDMLVDLLSDGDAAHALTKSKSSNRYRRRSMAAYALALAASATDISEATRKEIAVALSQNLANENAPYGRAARVRGRVGSGSAR